MCPGGGNGAAFQLLGQEIRTVFCIVFDPVLTIGFDLVSDAVLSPFFRRQKSTERAPKEHRKKRDLKNARRLDCLVSST
jgi:hypothetical protein